MGEKHLNRHLKTPRDMVLKKKNPRQGITSNSALSHAASHNLVMDYFPENSQTCRIKAFYSQRYTKAIPSFI